MAPKSSLYLALVTLVSAESALASLILADVNDEEAVLEAIDEEEAETLTAAGTNDN